MIFVSDIMKKKPGEATWTFETLRTNITEGKLEIIKFDFLDMQVTFHYVVHIFCPTHRYHYLQG